MTGKQLLSFLSLSLIMTTVTLAPPSVDAKKPKKYTITDRQETLKKEIDRAEKAQELTAKEAASLRDQESNIEAKEVKMKEKNNGNISYEDQTKIEKDLNKLSVRLQKLQLEKRVK